MRPCDAAPSHRDGHQPHTVAGGKSGQSFGRSSNVSHRLFSKLRVGPRPAARAALSHNHVLHVLLARAEDKVSIVDAWRHIAAMANVHAVGHFSAIGDFPRQHVRAAQFSLPIEVAVLSRRRQRMARPKSAAAIRLRNRVKFQPLSQCHAVTNALPSVFSHSLQSLHLVIAGQSRRGVCSTARLAHYSTTEACG